MSLPTSLGESSSAPGSVRLRELLAEAVARGASDVHIRAGSQALARIDGDLVPLSGQVFDALEARGLVSAAMGEPIAHDGTFDADFAVDLAGVGRFRGSAFRTLGEWGMVLRHVRDHIPNLEELGAPVAINAWLEGAQGLILITGPTGSGKSTTLAAMIGEINSSRSCHILTIEDPVEFIHRDKRASISQREVTTDTESFERALRSGLRQDPDVIVVGEIRDAASMKIVLQAAETGHLVMASMHAGSATDAIHRVINLFPLSEQDAVRASIAEAIVGIVCQRLLTSKSAGRCLVTEVLTSTTRTRDAIAVPDQADPLEEIIAEGEYYGMHTLMQDALRLVVDGTISSEEAVRVVPNVAEFDVALHRSGYRSAHV